MGRSWGQSISGEITYPVLEHSCPSVRKAASRLTCAGSWSLEIMTCINSGICGVTSSPPTAASSPRHISTFAATAGLLSLAFGIKTRKIGSAYGLMSLCVALTSNVRRRVQSSRFRLLGGFRDTVRDDSQATYVTVEYSNSVRSCINALRSDGMTYAGLCFARRPIKLTAITRFSKTSSLSAMKMERTFSACAKCLSNRSCKEERTVWRIVGSETASGPQEKHDTIWNLPGSAIPTVSNLSRTSLIISIA
jgi:hypothetical protein